MRDVYDNFRDFLSSSDTYEPKHHDCENYLERCRDNILAEVYAVKLGYGEKVQDEDDDLYHHLIKYKIGKEYAFHLYPDRPEEYDEMFDQGFIGTYVRQYVNTYKCSLPPYVTTPCLSPGKYKEFTDLNDNVPCNEDQRKIVMNLKHNLEIIQGPPGTGKSTTIYHIVTKRLVGRTLVTSRNNQAIAAVCEKLGGHHTSVFEGGSLHLVVLGNAERIAEASRPFHIDKLIRDELDRTPDVQRKQKVIDTKEAALNQLKAKLKKQEKAHRRFVKALDLDEKHYKRLVVFMGDTPSKSKCMKGYARYLTRLENGEEYVRMLDATKIDVCKLEVDRFSLLDAIKASEDLKGPAFCHNHPVHAMTVELDLLKSKLIQLKSVLSVKYKKRIMVQSNVFLSTIASAWRAKNITTVVIDEAATVEEESIPGLFPTKNLILIGDHKQLKPFTNVDAFEPLSFFERMVNNGHRVHLLKTQYRMAPCIGKMVSNAFYCGQLKHGVRYETETLKWIDHSAREEQDGTSYCNPHEATLVCDRAAAYRKANPSKTVMVITFYRAQLVKLKRRLDCKVVTVDACQGTEADAVFLSCVRSNRHGNIGFCKNRNRLCVALSRAKEALYVVGNKKTFKKGWKGVVKNIV